MLLTMHDVVAGYMGKPVLQSVSLGVNAGEILALIGPNGAGKSTVLKAVMGIVPPQSGRVTFDGRELTRLPSADHVTAGIGYVLQGGRVFTDLTIGENLVLGGYVLRDKREIRRRIDEALAIFPELKPRLAMRASVLSGGERQMLALCMSLVLRPKLWLLDEPSIGLSPAAVERIFTKVLEVRRQFGTAVMIVEQKVREALAIASRVAVLRLGRLVAEGRPDEFASPARLRELFLA